MDFLEKIAVFNFLLQERAASEARAVGAPADDEQMSLIDADVQPIEVRFRKLDLDDHLTAVFIDEDVGIGGPSRPAYPPR